MLRIKPLLKLHRLRQRKPIERRGQRQGGHRSDHASIDWTERLHIPSVAKHFLHPHGKLVIVHSNLIPSQVIHEFKRGRTANHKSIRRP